MNKWNGIAIISLGLLMLASLVLYILFGTAAVVTQVVLSLTGLGLLAFTGLNYKTLAVFFKKSGNITGLAKVAQVVIITGVFVFLYLITDSFSWKLDLTSSRLYSLSPETRKILSSVTNDIKVYYFRSPELSTPLHDYQENLIKAYVEKCSHLKYRKIDIVQNRTMAVDYDIKDGATVVFEQNKSKMTVSFNQLFDQDRQNQKLIYKGEQAFTTAIKSLSLSKQKNVYVLQGHGELNPMDGGYSGYKGIFVRLQDENIKLTELNLTKMAQIPADCSLLIIGNPKYPLSVDELDRIANYTTEGGNLLVLLEMESDITVNDILRQMGLFSLPNLVVEDQDAAPELGRINIMPQLLNSDITAPLARNRLFVVLPTARAVQTLPEDQRVSKDRYVLTPIMRTSKTAFGETSREEIARDKVIQDKKDLKGPLVLGCTSQRFKDSITTTREGDVTNSVESRMVVIGDSDFVNNVNFDKYGNSDLLLNSVNYLLKRDADITIRPKTSEITGFQLTSSERRFLSIFAFSLCVLYFVPGVIIVLMRRRKVKD